MKKYEHILTISGTETEPFLRFVGDIPIEKLLDVLEEAKKDGEELGYDNLKVYIREDCGIVDIDLHGDRPLTDDELQSMDEISVIARVKPLSDTGLNRDEILERNRKIYEKASS